MGKKEEERMENEVITKDTEVLVNLMNRNLWDYKAHRTTFKDDPGALGRVKGMTKELLALMQENYDFVKDERKIVPAYVH